MSEKKTTLPSFKNWKKIEVETEKVTKLLPNILTGNTPELNELIYTGTKLVRDKIDVLLRKPNRNAKV